jgi:hypothetical protein
MPRAAGRLSARTFEDAVPLVAAARHAGVPLRSAQYWLPLL